MRVIRNAKLRITQEHFSKAFGEAMGKHLYRKYKDLNYDIVEFFNTLDYPNRIVFENLIEEIGE